MTVDITTMTNQQKLDFLVDAIVNGGASMAGGLSLQAQIAAIPAATFNFPVTGRVDANGKPIPMTWSQDNVIGTNQAGAAEAAAQRTLAVIQSQSGGSPSAATIAAAVIGTPFTLTDGTQVNLAGYLAAILAKAGTVAMDPAAEQALATLLIAQLPPAVTAAIAHQWNK